MQLQTDSSHPSPAERSSRNLEALSKLSGCSCLLFRSLSRGPGSGKDLRSRVFSHIKTCEIPQLFLHVSLGSQVSMKTTSDGVSLLQKDLNVLKVRFKKDVLLQGDASLLHQLTILINSLKCPRTRLNQTKTFSHYLHSFSY